MTRRVRRAGNDRGATLILALVLITVIAVAIAGVLTVAFANMRATKALREQAATAAFAEAAAQVAINELRRGAYTGASGACFGDTDTLDIPPLPDGTASATVQCTYEPGSSSVPAPLASFPHALLTLPDPNSTEDGITVDVRGAGNQTSVTFAGNVSTTGTIHAEHGITAITNGTLAAATCDIRNSADITVAGVTLNRANPDPAYCATTGTPDPALVRPTGNGSTADPPTLTSTSGQSQTGWQHTCTNDTAKVTFQPGIYSSASELNDLTANCPDHVVYDFRPGVYWFNFTSGGANSNNVWRVTRGTLVAGSPIELPAEPVTTFPTPACDDTDGATFVFGGRAQWSLGSTARVQICGRPPLPSTPPAPEQPPLAIYGLKTSGAPIAAQSGCVTATSGNEGGNNPHRCPMLRINDQAQVYVRGATYAPLAWIDVNLNNPSGEAYQGGFAGGIVARRFDLNGTGNVTFAMPFSAAPPGPGQARTVVHLAVHVCPESSTCSTSGQHYLTVAVGLDDPSGTPVPGQRHVSIYAWNAIV